MTSVLFLTPADLGETVLASGAIEAAGQGAATTIVCASPAAALFRAMPGLAGVHVAEAGLAKSLALWRKLAVTRFDLIVDAHGGGLARLLRGRRLLSPRPGASARRRCEDWAAWLGAENVLPPKLWIDARARAEASRIASGPGPLLALAPAGASGEKIWPAERFAAVARRLVGGPMRGARLVLLGAGARDADIAARIVAGLEADGVAALDLTGELDLLGAAALLESATLCIGNDNALTHLAAAARAPTLTLFGPTDEHVRAPIGPRARAIRGWPLSPPLKPGQSLMGALSVDAVEAAALDVLKAGGLG